MTSPLPADYQSGLNAYQTGDYQTAINEWQKTAESPNTPTAIRAETLYAIGMLFWLGQGVQQDTIESASWLQLAAELDHPGAQTKLAYLYSTGQGVRHSDFQALKWWQMAAHQGDADAQYNLGVLYRDAKGVERNPAESLKWFREAAVNGDPVSATVIAEYQKNGELLSVDGTVLTLDGDEQFRYMAKPVEISVPEEVIHDPAEEDILTEAWIRQKNPEHYTIQVIALSQSEKLEKYIGRHPEWEPLAIYAQTRYQQPLWVLVQGDYPDVESARQAVREFPQDMQKRDKLWIRRFKMVQSLLE